MNPSLVLVLKNERWAKQTIIFLVKCHTKIANLKFNFIESEGAQNPAYNTATEELPLKKVKSQIILLMKKNGFNVKKKMLPYKYKLW